MFNNNSSTKVEEAIKAVTRSIEHFDMDSFMKKIQKECPKEYGLVKVETAGFVPLEVRFKRMQEAGIRAQFSESDFTSADWRDVYLEQPQFDVVEGDELEDIIEKQQGRMAYMQQLMKEKRGQSEATDDANLKEQAAEQPVKKTNEKTENVDKNS